MTGTAPATERFFGRRAELEQLHAGLERAANAEPAVFVLVGEAGIGKTTLLQRLSTSSDARLLQGNCIPVAGEAMPLAPVIAALRGLGRSLSAAEKEQLLGVSPNEFARLVPWEVPDSSPVRLPVSGDPSQVLSSSGQLRLFESLLSLLTELASWGPVIWSIEDVHWADRTTLDLIAFLARNLVDERVLLTATVRSDAVPRTHPLRGWLAELARLPVVTRIDLGRLSEEDTRRQVRALLGPNATATKRLDAVFEHSAGNPLYTEQLLPWVGNPGQPLPENLHDLVAARLDTLPATSRRVVEVAAILGREFDLESVAAVLSRQPAEVEAELRPAVDAHLVAPVRGSLTYSFVHPMFREVLEADLMPGDCQRLHADAAEALTAGSGAADAGRAFELTGQVARHWEVADRPARAFMAAIQAGLAAERMYAFTEADEYFSKALSQRARAAPAGYDSVPLDEVGLLAHAAQAAHLVGAGNRAVELADEAAALCPDPQRRAAILERKGAYSFNAGLAEEANTAYRAALALLPEESTTERAKVFAGLGMLAMGWTRLGEAEDACRQAITIARAVGARQEEGRALNALGVLTAYNGNFDGGIELSRQSVAIARGLSEPDDLAVAYINLSHLLGLAGRYGDEIEVCREGYAALQHLGLARQDGSFLQANAAEAMIKSGRWEEAAELLDEAVGQQSQGVRAFASLQQAGRLALRRGELEESWLRLNEARQLLDDYGAPDAWRRELAEVEAEWALWAGRPSDAYEWAAAALSEAEQGDEQRFAGWLVCLAAQAVADLAENARATGTDDQVETAMQRVSDLSARVASLDPDPLVATDHPLVEGAALAATITAELRRAYEGPTGGGEAWARSAAEWQRVGQPFFAAYARFRQAEAVVLARVGGEQPVAAVRGAHRAAAELGAGALLREIGNVAKWGRIDLGPRATEAEDDQQVSAAGLTPRELEVLAGLVAGQTNREIAESLFISVKTASVHVSNILRKTRSANREEAARMAHRGGLVDTLPGR